MRQTLKAIWLLHNSLQMLCCYIAGKHRHNKQKRGFSFLFSFFFILYRSVLCYIASSHPQPPLHLKQSACVCSRTHADVSVITITIRQTYYRKRTGGLSPRRLLFWAAGAQNKYQKERRRKVTRITRGRLAGKVFRQRDVTFTDNSDANQNKRNNINNNKNKNKTTKYKKKNSLWEEEKKTSDDRYHSHSGEEEIPKTAT